MILTANEKARAKYKSLPWWKRLFTPEPLYLPPRRATIFDNEWGF